jgi:hypothetical protein
VYREENCGLCYSQILYHGWTKNGIIPENNFLSCNIEKLRASQSGIIANVPAESKTLLHVGPKEVKVLLLVYVLH